MPTAKRTLPVLISVITVALGLPVIAPAIARAAPSVGLVISEVYGGGGNSGATVANDFIEIANRGADSVDLSAYAVQYKSAAGATWSGKTPLTGSVAPGAYYLIQEASGGSSGAALPSPNVTGTLNLSASAGTVALTSTTATLTCTLAACADAPGVVDLVGFGSTATTFEGTSAAPAPSATLSDQRVSTADTDQNAQDFVAAAPTPGVANVTAGAGGGGVDCSITPTPADCVPGTTTVQDIQGSSWKSPLVGTVVTRVPGVVTAVRATGTSKGFFIQELAPDPGRPAASSGVFVFTSTPTVSVGDSVLVSGAVKEYYPLASGETLATTSSLSTTEIDVSTVTTIARSVALPPALVLTPTTVPDTFAAPGASVDPHSIETTDPLQPTRSAQEFFEAHEGMLLQVNDAQVVGPGKPEYGEIYVTSKPAEQMTPRGGTYIAGYSQVPAGRLLVAPVNGVVPAANVGDALTGPTVGPVDWSTFGGYDVAATQLGTYKDNGLTGNVATPQANDQLAVATYNVENLAPSDPQSKFDRLAAGVVHNLASPDVISVEEIQDNSGATDDGTVAADQTIDKFTSAITAAGGPAYLSASIDPVNDQDGGEPGGNIRVVFLYNPARVSFDAKAGGTSTSATTVSTGPDLTAELSASPGRVDPTNAAWTTSRKPLAGEFTFAGKKVIVIANHFDSKGGDQDSDGRYQPAARSSEIQRNQQATVLNGFVKQILQADPSANVVLAGDFNDYQFSTPITTLTDNGATLSDLINTLPENERYTYNYNGISQVLDHIFVSKPLSSAPAGSVQYDVIHVNSEFSDQASDHDPQVVRIRPVAVSATTDLNLLNINDFHGRIDANTVKFAGTVEQLRATGGEANTLFLSAGDNVGASLFASASQNDQPTIDVLNALNLNASAVGNHEFDKGYDDLVNRIIGTPPNAKWDYLGANVYLKGTTTPALPEYQIFTVNGIRVGVIGAVTQETPSLVSPGGTTALDFGDPVAAVNRVADQLTDGDASNGEADVLVAEYHEGATEGTPDGATLDQEIAAGGPFAEIVQQTSAKVAAIFTGHTHKEYAWDAPVPGNPSQTRPVLQTGDYGANVGQVVLSVDRASKKITAYTSQNVPRITTDDATLVARYPRVAAVKTIVDAALAKAAVIGNQKIGSVTADITTAYLAGARDDRQSESTLGNLVANALRDQLASPDLGGAQIGVVNPGGLRDELLYAPDGTVTYAEANSVLPFVNNLWTLSLTGAQFKQVLEQMWQPAGSSRPFLNLGLSDNVSYTIDPTAATGSHITSITVNGAPLSATSSYRIGTFSFLGTGGDNFTAFTAATNVKDTGLVDRDAWIAYLTKNSPVSPSFARRGVVVSSLPSTVQAGATVSFGVSKLDLTSLGSPANTTLAASIGSTPLGSFPVSVGAATVSVTVPLALSGAQTLTLTAAPSGTKVSIPLTVTPKPITKGTVTVSPGSIAAGKSVTVSLAGWSPATSLAVQLDGTTGLGSVTTDAKGVAKVTVTIPRATKVGAHAIVARAVDGTSVSAVVSVLTACVLKPASGASIWDYLVYLLALLTGRAC